MIYWEHPGIPKDVVKRARQIVANIVMVSPVLHELKIILVNAYSYPDANCDLVNGQFFPPRIDLSIPVICACALGNTMRDTICHEWGHYEQYRDRKPIIEDIEIVRRTRRLLHATRAIK